MKLIATLMCTILVPCLSARAEDPTTLVSQATAAYQAKKYARSAELYVAAIEAGVKNANVPYNTACCYALLGKRDEAFRYLTMAVDRGWRDVEHMESDTDLTSLHKDERWAAIVKHGREESAKFAKSLGNPKLRDELRKRQKEDQAVRMANPPDMEKWHKVDDANRAWIKEVIEKHGLPGFKMVGQDGALAVFLMIQHSDPEPDFQRKCLALMKAAYEKKDFNGQHVAYLTDRVLLAEGKKQIYGTQFQTVDGKLQPRPLEDEKNVDARRKEVGLGPLAEYAKIMEAQQRPAATQPQRREGSVEAPKG